MKYFLFPFTVIILVGLNACTSTDNITQTGTPIEVPETADSVFAFQETSYDFGVIKQSGGKVSHDFSFTYSGEEPLRITGVPTSCACTSASVNSTQLKKGDTGILTVKFNPNLHEEPDGRFFKTVALLTDPPLENIPEVKIWAEIDLDLGPEAFELKEEHDDEEEHETEQEYHSITPVELSSVLAQDDVLFVDVHIPEQKHLPGTDLFIPYNEIGDNLHQLPANKDKPIVLYCRSGGMSRAAAYVLTEHGYTNIYDLVGGKNAYDAWSGDMDAPSALLHPDRVTKKPFGIYVTPENSPVQPERFSGYHTGTDFEVQKDEDASAITVAAVCDGAVSYKGIVDGYGGVLTQQCMPDENPVTVLYGHIAPNSVVPNAGDILSTGDLIGNLGGAFSKEAGGERAHLHLGVIRGTTVDFRGYVPEETLLSQWIDPITFLNFSTPPKS